MIHVGRHAVLVEGRPVDLSATEFRVLHFLAKRPGWVFTREQILDAVHGDNYAITPCDRRADRRSPPETGGGGKVHRDRARCGLPTQGVSWTILDGQPWEDRLY